MKRAFSDWTKWTDRAALADLGYPGVYALAISPAELSAMPFSWRLEIVYVGMTNAKGGLKSRLQQFDNTIKGGDGHGGGHRVRFKHSDYHELTSHLFVSVCPWECDVTLNDPANLRLMGEVTKHEYECFALFVEMFGNLPEFNDKKKSPKK
ncbi:MAG: hypothetical protein QG591_1689 [Planctomycetota bacterium]|nr:hypothetical protein [Planctomycetota bacterium]